MSKTLKVLTLFSGYDSQAMALDRIQQENPSSHYDLVGWCEIDAKAIISHNAVYPQYKDRNLGDITKVNPSEVPNCDLLTYSAPCTDISRTGHRQGFEEGSGTRSALLWRVKDIIREKRPKFLVMENVDAILDEGNYEHFVSWCDTLTELDYRSWYKIMNASDYGVPQNRKRLIMVSIRKDLAKSPYKFPKPIELTMTADDILEDIVDEKDYMNDHKVQPFIDELRGYDTKAEYESHDWKGAKHRTSDNGIKLKAYATPFCSDNIYCTFLASHYESANYRNLTNCSQYSKQGVMEVWTADDVKVNYSILGGDYQLRKKPIRNARQQELLDVINNLKPGQYIRIRRLTPTEALRLMGVSESHIKLLCNSACKDEDIYKQAGNSIVVNVLYQTFKKLLINTNDKNGKY